MIARMWTGQVPKAKSAEYLRLMREVAIDDYRTTRGNEGAWLLHREEGENVTVMMLSFWRDLEDIRGFSGEDIGKAKYYDFDASFLSHMPEHVEHYRLDG